MINLLKVNCLINYAFKSQSGQNRAKSCGKEKLGFLESKFKWGMGELKIRNFYALTLRARATPTVGANGPVRLHLPSA